MGSTNVDRADGRRRQDNDRQHEHPSQFHPSDHRRSSTICVGINYSQPPPSAHQRSAGAVWHAQAVRCSLRASGATGGRGAGGPPRSPGALGRLRRGYPARNGPACRVEAVLKVLTRRLLGLWATPLHAPDAATPATAGACERPAVHTPRPPGCRSGRSGGRRRSTATKRPGLLSNQSGPLSPPTEAKRVCRRAPYLLASVYAESTIGSPITPPRSSRFG